MSGYKLEDKVNLQKEMIDKKLALAYFIFSSIIPMCFYIHTTGQKIKTCAKAT